MARLKLRPASRDDDQLLLEIYASTRAEEMSMVPWTKEQQTGFLSMQFQAQQEHYQRKYPNATHDIIEFQDMPVGRMYVAKLADEIRIVDVTLLPHHRGNGIGTYLISELMNEAAANQLPLRIYVETFNPSLKFFERLGFAQTAQHGMHFLMEWMPG